VGVGRRSRRIRRIITAAADTLMMMMMMRRRVLFCVLSFLAISFAILSSTWTGDHPCKKEE
jgi:hypothetical protein